MVREKVATCYANRIVRRFLLHILLILLIFLLRFPISTHYTHFEPWTFAVCFATLIINIFPKFPQVLSI